MRHITLLVVCLASLAGCRSASVPSDPRPGLVAAPPGGAEGYQHGARGSRFLVGNGVTRVAELGYLKTVGDSGILAIDVGNGSAFGRPRARSAHLHDAPFGGSPEAHDRFVRDYFVGLGLPPAQIATVRSMSILEASGRSAARERVTPRLTAYYSVLQRAVNGVAVPDSFAWARVAVGGGVVEEGIYWPALPSRALAEAREIQAALADPERRRVLDAQVPAGATTTVAIRHTAATTGQAFIAVGVYDVTAPVSPAPRVAARAAGGTMVSTRHVDVRGATVALPQERIGEERAAAAKAASAR